MKLNINRLSAYLVLNCISKTEAASIMGISLSHLYKRLNGTYPFNSNELEALAARCNIKVEEFYKGNEELV